MTRLLTILLALAVPAIALAAGGGGHGEAHAIPWKEMAFHAVNLAILVGGIVYFAKAPVMDSLKNRSARVRKDLEESHTLRKDAQDRFDDLEAKLARFEQQLEETRAEAATEAENEARAIAAKVEEEVAWIKEAAEKTIRDEIVNARSSLQREAVELAVQIAEETLAQSISAEDQDRMARDLLGAVAGEVNANG